MTADATSYGYDAIYRLTSETHPSGALSYLLDPVGSRLSLASTLSGITSQSLAYHPNDRIVGNTYDANGNTLVSGARTFAWDSQNRLMAVNGGVATMLYDGDGNRVGKNGIRYLVDDNNPTGLPQVMEEIAGGAVIRTYTYGHERISQTQLVSGAWTTSHYGYDEHGDVRFEHNRGAEGLSQRNGWAIFIRTRDWTPGSKFCGPYGRGTMMHELLHKFGPTYEHTPIKNALFGWNPPEMTSAFNSISNALAARCF